jgi:hypothetical protein
VIGSIRVRRKKDLTKVRFRFFRKKNSFRLQKIPMNENAEKASINETDFIAMNEKASKKKNDFTPMNEKASKNENDFIE